ncbi:MAG: transposase [Candidatus Micrarchaeota archaeon]
MKTYKFRVYPSKTQQKELNTHLWLAKNLWNELLAHCKQTYNDFGYFPTKNTLQLMVKGYGMFSQTQQEISHRVFNSIIRMFKLKKKGKKIGFPRFKSFDRMKSLHYPQFGFWLNNKLKVAPFGEISIKKHREIKGRIKTLTIKREASGKWFANFSVEQERKQPKENNGEKVGVDLGLMKFATFSNGKAVKNPRHFNKHKERLAFYQKRLSRKKKKRKNCKAKNMYKAKIKVAKQYEKVSNTRADFLHKLSSGFVSNYSLIALEKLASQEMAEQNFGKSINDAGWGMCANMICYKAEEAGCKVVFVDPKNTTQECSNCQNIVKKDITERMHNCSFCGLSIDRDLNAARNILIRATAGIAGSNACEDETMVSSVKQEAMTSIFS